mgnify:CR=1 FL=1
MLGTLLSQDMLGSILPMEMTQSIGHDHDVQFIWNYWPFYYFMWPLSFLNILLFPFYILQLPLMAIWNIIGLILQFLLTLPFILIIFFIIFAFMAVFIFIFGTLFVISIPIQLLGGLIYLIIYLTEATDVSVSTSSAWALSVPLNNLIQN